MNKATTEKLGTNIMAYCSRCKVYFPQSKCPSCDLEATEIVVKTSYTKTKSYPFSSYMNKLRKQEKLLAEKEKNNG